MIDLKNIRQGRKYEVGYKLKYNKRGVEVESIRRFTGICNKFKRNRIGLYRRIKGILVFLNLDLASKNILYIKQLK